MNMTLSLSATERGQNDAGGHFHHETLGQLRHVNETALLSSDGH
jgi:hypothetical protein